MIYLDTSVALAQLLAEDRRPTATFWSEALVSSRLMEYEIWTRLHARRLADSHGEAALRLMGRVALLDLAQPVLARALHLASCDFLCKQGQSVALASYDRRMMETARAMEIPLWDLE